MTSQTVVQTEEQPHSSMAVAFLLCSLSGCVMGFILGIATVWL